MAKHTTDLSPDTFFGMSIGEGALIPNADPFQGLPEKVRFNGEITFKAIKPVTCALAKNAGMMTQIRNLVFEGDVVLTDPQFADEPAVQDISVFLPIMFAESGFKPSRDETSKLKDNIRRGEEKLAGHYAYIGLPLIADPKAENRLAPQGNLLSPAGWAEILDKPVPCEVWISVDGNGNRWTNFKVKSRM